MTATGYICLCVMKFALQDTDPPLQLQGYEKEALKRPTLKWPTEKYQQIPLPT